MQTLSSASLTCIASLSAVELTATVEIPSSFAARITRSAISPRLAIRILSNILFDHHQRLAIFDRRAVLHEDLYHLARAGGDDLVIGLHRLDQHQLVAGFHHRAELDERL